MSFVRLTAVCTDPRDSVLAFPAIPVPLSREVGAHAHGEVAIDDLFVDLERHSDCQARQGSEDDEDQLSTDEGHGFVSWGCSDVDGRCWVLSANVDVKGMVGRKNCSRGRMLL